jgi:hypothetical protein
MAIPSRPLLICRYDQMWKAGTISCAQWKVCSRYLALAEAVEGGLPCSLREAVPVPRHCTERQVYAKLSLEAAHAALGPSARGLCDALILENLSVRAIAERAGMRPDVALGQVLAALTRLVEHWNMR